MLETISNQSVLSTVSSWILIGVLTVWTVATALRVFRPAKDWMHERLGVGLTFVPSYRFFAPDPGKYDFHVLYREKLDDGSVTRWRECDELNDLPTRLHWIWNPQMYDTKAMFDYAQNLSSAFKEVDEEDAEADGGDSSDESIAESAERPTSNLRSVDIEDYVLTTPYMSLLNYVSNRAEHADAAEIQYLVMRGSLRDEESEPVLVSYFHELEA